ncbi:MAG: homocysteine S-methyltransferase family protein [Bacteroidota bacterium]
MSTTSLIASLLSRGTVLTDGAWGTQLATAGLPAGEVPDLWNLSNPAKVEAVARQYVDAGSRVILTNTFRANRIALSHYDDTIDIAALNASGVRISRAAAGERALVFASIGPSGKMLVSGEVTGEQLDAAFGEQSAALASAGADAIVIETMSDIEEATIAVRAAKRTGLPIVASMVFDSGPDKTRTMMGVTPEDAATALREAGADVIGANCGLGIEHYLVICQRLKKATPLPIWIKANAGLPQLVDGQVTYTITPEQYAASAITIVAAGAAFIGGCCGTTPAFIRAIAGLLNAGHSPHTTFARLK